MFSLPDTPAPRGQSVLNARRGNLFVFLLSSNFFFPLSLYLFTTANKTAATASTGRFLSFGSRQQLARNCTGKGNTLRPLGQWTRRAAVVSLLFWWRRFKQALNVCLTLNVSEV